MPTISIFFGIVIKMFFDDHNPPIFMLSIKEKKRYSIFAEICCVAT